MEGSVKRGWVTRMEVLGVDFEEGGEEMGPDG